MVNLQEIADQLAAQNDGVESSEIMGTTQTHTMNRADGTFGGSVQLPPRPSETTSNGDAVPSTEIVASNPKGAFGFSTPEAALSGSTQSFPGLPVLQDGQQYPCMPTNEQKQLMEQRQIACIVMKRVAQWFSDNGFPVVITPYVN